MRDDKSAKYWLTCPWNVRGDVNCDKQIIAV
jgi:hypothetical protein